MVPSFITSFCGKVPRIDPGAFVDFTARIIGDVTIQSGASIWPMAVLRADSSSIFIGEYSSVLDLALLEAPRGYPVTIEEASLVSHGAIIHGASIGRNVLVGMGAIVLEGVTISSGSIVGAGCLVPAGTLVPANSFMLGTPGRIIRGTTEKERQATKMQAQGLFQKSRTYLKEMSSAF